jgi:tripartite-type tricarboxylate transporter receptor subunit TctC
MQRNLPFVLRALIVLALLVAPSVAPAQAPYPSQTIKFIVPYAPGGLPDTVARIVGQRLSDRLGQPVVVENRAGANGGVAAGRSPVPRPTATRSSSPTARCCRSTRCCSSR